MEAAPPGPTHVDAGGSGALAPPHMFGHLLASRPNRDIGATARYGLGAIVLHGILITALVIMTMSVSQEMLAQEEYQMIELPPEPPPPPPPPNVKTPEVEAPKGFQTLVVPEVIPVEIPVASLSVVIREEDYSGVGVEGGVAKTEEEKPVNELAAAPTFTPFTVAPELANRELIMQTLVREYPPLLRDAGIGGQVLLWVFIDANGNYVKSQVKVSSGYLPLDQAAEKVASKMQFRPAYNRDRKVPVWVEIPILFTSH